MLPACPSLRLMCFFNRGNIEVTNFKNLMFLLVVCDLVVTLGSHNIPFSDSAMNLGFILDSKLSMKKHKNLPNHLFRA